MSQPDQQRIEILNYQSVETDDYLKRGRSKNSKIDPANMRPAGVKSNADQIYRNDSIQFLEMNRNKLNDSKLKADYNRTQMNQSDRFADAFNSNPLPIYKNERVSSTTKLGYTESDPLSFKLKFPEYDSMQRSNQMHSSRSDRPSSANAEFRSGWNSTRKPDLANELDSGSRRLTHDVGFSMVANHALSKGKNNFFDEIDNLITNYEQSHKPYEWQINKAQIDLSKEYSSNY